MSKFRHHDADEREMPVYVPEPYEAIDFSAADVRVGRFASATFCRTPLMEVGIAVDDDRVFTIGLDESDRSCAHTVEVDRFGFGRCTRCRGHLFCSAWMASGVFGDDTLAHANGTASDLAARLPKLHLITRNA